MAIIKEIESKAPMVEIKINLKNKRYVLQVSTEKELIEDLSSVSKVNIEVIDSIIRAYKKFSYTIWENQQRGV